MKNFMTLLAVGLALIGLLAPPVAADDHAETIATGIAGASGSTIGPDGALYVTESFTGSVLRIDPDTGATSVYATGLPTAVAPIGGPMDLVFKDGTAYVLVSLVGEFFGTPDPSGIYRLDGPGQWTVIADLGSWAADNLPQDDLDWFITTGVHYAIETSRGGFVVSEAHHNKVLAVSTAGDIELLEEYGNTVPSGLEAHGSEIHIAMTGAVPHLPEDGQIVTLDRKTGATTLVAAGGPLLLDVERRGNTVYGLAQGFFTPGLPAGAPAEPNTGELLVADGNGGFDLILGGLDRPTSFEVVGNTAWVIGLGGDVVRVDLG